MARINMKRLEAMQAAGEQIDWTKMERDARRQMTALSREFDKRRNLNPDTVDMGGTVAYLGFNQDGTVHHRCTQSPPDFINIPAENLGGCPHEEQLEIANRVNLETTRNPGKVHAWRWHTTPYRAIDEIGDHEVLGDVYDYGCGAEVVEEIDWATEDEAWEERIEEAREAGTYDPDDDPIDYGQVYAVEIHRYTHLKVEELEAEQDIEHERYMLWLLEAQYRDHDDQPADKQYIGPQWARHKRDVNQHPKFAKRSQIHMSISEGDLEDEIMQRLDRHFPLPKRPTPVIELLEAAERRKLEEALQLSMNRANYQSTKAVAA